MNEGGRHDGFSVVILQFFMDCMLLLSYLNNHHHDRILIIVRKTEIL